MKENQLIAEFMGMTYGDPNDNSVMIQMTPQGNEVVPIESMKYHTSWDWLMPVIDKCYQQHMSKHIAEAVMTCNINEAYQVVVEFINEFNKN